MATNKEYHVPLLPLRGLMVFPTMVLHLDVGREKSIEALEQAMLGDNIVVLSTQKEVGTDNPKKDDLYAWGTLTKVKQMLKLPNGTVRVLVEGLERAKIEEFVEKETHWEAKLLTYPHPEEKDAEDEALMRTLLDYFHTYTKLSKKTTIETYHTVSDITEPGRMADIITSHLPINMKEKQTVPRNKRCQRPSS